MDIPFSRYTEKLPEEFSVRHKITETTEKRIPPAQADGNYICSVRQLKMQV
mgnify:CR=1 FL=1